MNPFDGSFSKLELRKHSSCVSGTSSVDLKSRATIQQPQRLNPNDYQNFFFNQKDSRGEDSVRRSAAPSLAGEQINQFQDNFWITNLNEAPLQPLQFGRAKSFQERRFFTYGLNKIRLSNMMLNEVSEPEFPNDHLFENGNDPLDATGVTPNFNYVHTEQLSSFPAFEKIKSFIGHESSHCVLPSINFDHLTAFLAHFYKGQDVNRFDVKFTDEERRVIASFIRRKYRKDLKLM